MQVGCRTAPRFLSDAGPFDQPGLGETAAEAAGQREIPVAADIGWTRRRDRPVRTERTPAPDLPALKPHPFPPIPAFSLALLLVAPALAADPPEPLRAGDSRVFTAPAGAVSCRWRLDGAVTGPEGTRFTFTPAPKDAGPRYIESEATLPGGEVVRTGHRIRVSLPVAESTATFHVSTAGHDAQPGTATAPFRTFERARDAIRAMPRPLPAGGVTVYLHGGTYHAREPFRLTEADSGSTDGPVVYRAFPGERPVISGGKPMPASAFTPLSPAVRDRVAPGIPAEKILELDLAAAGIRHAGPLPDGFNQWITRNPQGDRHDGGLCELIYHGARMPLSEYPNADPAADEATSPFLTMDGVAEGMAADGSSHLNGMGVYLTAGGEAREVGAAFHYRPEDAARIERWQSALRHGGAWLQGYWRIPWQFDGARIIGIDPAKRVIQLARNRNRDAVWGKIGDKYQRLAGNPAGSRNERFRAVNLLEEIDRPGEWAIDSSRGKLYFLPPGEIKDGSVVVSDNPEPLVRIAGASHARFVGLGFEAALSGGVSISGGNHNLVTGCSFRNMNAHAVELRGGSSHGVMSCDMEELGGGGIILLGGDENSTPRVAAGHFAVNNRIEGFGRVVRVYAAAIDCGFGGASGGSGGGGHAEAVGMRIANNLIRGGPHSAILHGSWDNEFSSNEITDWCRVSDDMGGIYSYDRFARHGGGVFRYNHLHNSPHGDGIYFDHDHREMKVYGNIVDLRGRGRRGIGYLYKIGSQTDPAYLQTLECHDNLALNCRSGFEFFAPPRKSRPSVIEDNVAIRCAPKDFTWKEILPSPTGSRVATSKASALESGPNLAFGSDPGFFDESGGTLRLRRDSRLRELLPGFDPAPFERAGLFHDEFRREIPALVPTSGRKRDRGMSATPATAAD